MSRFRHALIREQVKMSSDYGARLRDELSDDYRVFYATAWGTMADHLPNWFIRALNAHRDILALPANEGPRQKYLGELTRAERPPLVPYTEFLNDIGTVFGAIGDCFSYRAGQMPALRKLDRYRNIPLVNMPRHPFPWLQFHVRWRATNMRMREGRVDPLAWEWKVTPHAYFEHLGLRGYTRDEIDVWTAFQGMLQLNNVLGDLDAAPRHVPFETVADDPPLFAELVKYLSQGKVEYDRADLDRAYSTRYTLFHGEEQLECDPREVFATWQGWKVDAFRKLVTPAAIDAYKSFGYDLLGIERRPHAVTAPSGGVARPVFVASMMKSGTHLLRELLEGLTGLRASEPPIASGEPDYANEMLIDFAPGTFFSWHSILTSRSLALLRGAQSRNLFLVRNIYDVILSIYRHLSQDVDAAAGRSVVGGDYFRDKSVEQALSLVITGFTSPKLTWHGIGPLLRQMESFLGLVESGEGLLLSYEEMIRDKRQTLAKVMKHLDCWVSEERQKRIIAATSPAAMREKDPAHALHATPDAERLTRSAFSPFHKEMVDFAVLAHAPNLPARLTNIGHGDLLALGRSAHNAGDSWASVLPPQGFFAGVRQSEFAATLDGSALGIEMSLKVKRSPNALQTVLDFEHAVGRGCVLQIEERPDTSEAELCWYCAGVAIVGNIPFDRFVDIRCGYDPKAGTASLSIDGAPKPVAQVQKNPFPQSRIRVGIGQWLEQVGREFHGEIRRLTVQGIADITRRAAVPEPMSNQPAIPQGRLRRVRQFGQSVAVRWRK